MEENQMNESSVVENEPKSPPSLNMNDLSSVVRIIDVVSERGAFKGSELESVGSLRNRIEQFLNFNQEKPAETESSESNTQ
jgi:hypothetical protein